MVVGDGVGLETLPGWYDTPVQEAGIAWPPCVTNTKSGLPASSAVWAVYLFGLCLLRVGSSNVLAFALLFSHQPLSNALRVWAATWGCGGALTCGDSVAIWWSCCM